MKKLEMRDVRGMSLVEMLATILIMGIVAAAITDIAVTQNIIAFRTFNKIDALTNARRVASFIERDIHNASFIGDQSNTANQNEYPGPPTYTLSGQTLIIQLPIFYSPSATGGIPAIPTSYTVPGTPVVVNGTTYNYTTTFWNVDTIIYQIIGDTSRAGTGQFVLQKTVIPGLHPTNYETAPTASNQTILAGIVGPQDLTLPTDPTAGTSPPAVFGYFSKQSPLYQSAQSTTTPSAANINGVSINLEVFSNASSKRVDLTPRSMAFRTEVYVRGNYYSP
jgi:prepilin-type N-terminal cleavage/methylation domain-containing protein